MRAPETGPVTIKVYEGMVKVAERTYLDAPAVLISHKSWPQWVTRTMHKIKREADERSTGDRPQ